MTESQGHQDLVAIACRYIDERFAGSLGFASFVDAPRTLRGGKPPRVGGFVPDIFAMDVPTTMHVIGEAKTAADLEVSHTRAQLVAFLSYLRIRGGVLVVTVPWKAIPIARRVVKNAVDAVEAHDVEIVILDDLGL